MEDYIKFTDNFKIKNNGKKKLKLVIENTSELLKTNYE